MTLLSDRSLPPGPSPGWEWYERERGGGAKTWRALLVKQNELGRDELTQEEMRAAIIEARARGEL
jgi:hypothetical protein